MIRVYIHICTCVCIHTHIYVYTYTNIYTHEFTYIYVCIQGVYVYVYIYIHTYIYIYRYVYIYIHNTYVFVHSYLYNCIELHCMPGHFSQMGTPGGKRGHMMPASTIVVVIYDGPTLFFEPIKNSLFWWLKHNSSIVMVKSLI